MIGKLYMLPAPTKIHIKQTQEITSLTDLELNRESDRGDTASPVGFLVMPVQTPSHLL